MHNLLENAISASKRDNWSQVAYHLQNLVSTSHIELNEEENQKAIELTLKVFINGDFQQKWEIAKVFPKLGKTAILPLIELLESEEAELETRWFVCRILSECNDPTCAIALANLLRNAEDEELSMMASQALANLGISAIEALRELLQAENSRLLAVQALSQIRRFEIVEPLLEVVNDSSPEIRTIAIEALGSFHDERILTVLIAALKDTAPSVRKEAAIAIGLRTLQCNLVERLKPLLYDLNIEVCQQAAIALGRMKTDAAADELFKVLQSPLTPVGLKLTLVRSLSWMETALSLNYLQEGLIAQEAEVCQEIITVLGRIEESGLRKKATQILIEFFSLQSKIVRQTNIKQALAMSLGELGQPEALELLQRLAEDEDKIVKLHAIAALKKYCSVV
ncbi:MAG: HEAT repeat domain-containing protein [Hydrococcus sp. Prado102]|jgi:HEAT repeat protein|nr:HEAT repeat domain-containing protein [Hydrococcus sp. Prado102]